MALSIPDFSATTVQRAKAAEKQRTELGQGSFLRLMTEQLKHQDPLKPLDSNEFLGQLAQFSTVQGITGLQESFTGVSNALTADQGLQGAAMLGHTALIPADRATLGTPVDGQTRGIDGAIFAEGPGTVTMEITDAGGQLVKRIEVQANQAGDTAIHWDGTDASGAAVPAGEYRFKASYTGSTGQAAAAVPMLAGKVDSVVLSSQGLLLNLGGIGQVPLSAVRSISS